MHAQRVNCVFPQTLIWISFAFQAKAKLCHRSIKMQEHFFARFPLWQCDGAKKKKNANISTDIINASDLMMELYLPVCTFENESYVGPLQRRLAKIRSYIQRLVFTVAMRRITYIFVEIQAQYSTTRHETHNRRKISHVRANVMALTSLLKPQQHRTCKCLYTNEIAQTPRQ